MTEKWTTQEENSFLEGLTIHGREEYTRIAFDNVPTKSPEAVKKFADQWFGQFKGGNGRGKWMPAEEAAFVRCRQLFRDAAYPFKKISICIPTRDSKQVKSHAQKADLKMAHQLKDVNKKDSDVSNKNRKEKVKSTSTVLSSSKKRSSTGSRRRRSTTTTTMTVDDHDSDTDDSSDDDIPLAIISNRKRRSDGKPKSTEVKGNISNNSGRRAKSSVSKRMTEQEKSASKQTNVAETKRETTASKQTNAKKTERGKSASKQTNAKETANEDVNSKTSKSKKKNTTERKLTRTTNIKRVSPKLHNKGSPRENEKEMDDTMEQEKEESSATQPIASAEATMPRKSTRTTNTRRVSPRLRTKDTPRENEKEMDNTMEDEKEESSATQPTEEEKEESSTTQPIASKEATMHGTGAKNPPPSVKNEDDKHVAMAIDQQSATPQSETASENPGPESLKMKPESNLNNTKTEAMPMSGSGGSRDKDLVIANANDEKTEEMPMSVSGGSGGSGDKDLVIANANGEETVPSQANTDTQDKLVGQSKDNRLVGETSQNKKPVFVEATPMSISRGSSGDEHDRDLVIANVAEEMAPVQSTTDTTCMDTAAPPDQDDSPTEESPQTKKPVFVEATQVSNLGGLSEDAKDKGVSAKEMAPAQATTETLDTAIKDDSLGGEMPQMGKPVLSEAEPKSVSHGSAGDQQNKDMAISNAEEMTAGLVDKTGTLDRPRARPAKKDGSVVGESPPTKQPVFVEATKSWSLLFIELNIFKNQNGHANPTEGQLADWLNQERKLFAQGNHPSPTQIHFLRAIECVGFEKKKNVSSPKASTQTKEANPICLPQRLQPKQTQVNQSL